jgi:hypothetical protein
MQENMKAKGMGCLLDIFAHCQGQRAKSTVGKIDKAGCALTALSWIFLQQKNQLANNRVKPRDSHKSNNSRLLSEVNQHLSVKLMRTKLLRVLSFEFGNVQYS